MTASGASELLTPRLLLRCWRPEDAEPMAAINADAEVTRHLNRPPDADTPTVFVPWMVDHWAQHGFGPFALESREPTAAGEFLGFAGVAYPEYLGGDAAARPELGWRLARAAWGRGLATEATVVARDHAFATLGLPELISIVHPDNVRSQRVATKLGMRIERQIHNPLLGRDVDVWVLERPLP